MLPLASAALESPVANNMTNVTSPGEDNKINSCSHKYEFGCSAKERNNYHDLECIDGLTLTDIKMKCKAKKLGPQSSAISKDGRNSHKALPIPTQNEHHGCHTAFKFKKPKSRVPKLKQTNYAQPYAETVKISEGADPYRCRNTLSGSGYLNSNVNVDYTISESEQVPGLITGKLSNADRSFSLSDLKKKNLYHGKSTHSAKSGAAEFAHCVGKCFASGWIHDPELLSRNNLLDTSTDVPSEGNGVLDNGRPCNLIEETEEGLDDALTGTFLQQKNISHPATACVVNSIPQFDLYEIFQTELGQTDNVECEKEMTLSDSIETHCSVNNASAEIVMLGKVKKIHSKNDKSRGYLNIAASSGNSNHQKSRLLPSNQSTCSLLHNESMPGTANPSDISYNIDNNNISLEVIFQEKIIQKNNSADDNSKSFYQRGQISGNSYCSLVGREDIVKQINKETIEHNEDPFTVHGIPCSTVLNDSGNQMIVQDMCIANGEKHAILFIGESSTAKNGELNNGQHLPQSSKVITASNMEDELPCKSKKFLSTSMDQMLSSQTEAFNSISVDELSVVKYTGKPSFAMVENSSYLPETSCFSVSLECSNDRDSAKGSKICEDLKEAISPKKLLSTRLTISPVSQEKLCQALSDIDLHGALPHPRNRKRLLFEKFVEHGMPSVLDTKDAELLGYGKKAKRTKSCRNGLNKAYTKGILKPPDALLKKHVSNDTSLMHKQTEEAVTFLERQMCDFASVASKLLNGIKSLKHLVEENFLTEEYVSTLSNIPVDKIQETVRNTSELEDTTKRWLSMLTKDCTRFCKIMRAREKEAAGFVNAAQKGRKISFADEAGGALCHVKVLEPHPDSCVSQEEKGNINMKGNYPTP